MDNNSKINQSLKNDQAKFLKINQNKREFVFRTNFKTTLSKCNKIIQKSIKTFKRACLIHSHNLLSPSEIQIITIFSPLKIRKFNH